MCLQSSQGLLVAWYFSRVHMSACSKACLTAHANTEACIMHRRRASFLLSPVYFSNTWQCTCAQVTLRLRKLKWVNDFSWRCFQRLLHFMKSCCLLVRHRLHGKVKLQRRPRRRNGPGESYVTYKKCGEPCMVPAAFGSMLCSLL